MKLDIKVNSGQQKLVEFVPNTNSIQVNNANQLFTAVEKGNKHFTLLLNNKSIDVFVLKFDKKAKSATLVVNGKKCELTAMDEMDILLKNLGMDSQSGKKMKELRAPMPGLVVKFEVTAGSEVKKDQILVVLEAMKMENVLKAQADGVVQSIEAKQGQAVEKNQVLIKFS